MSRQGKTESLTECICQQETRNAGASRGIRLKHIDCAALQHATKIHRIVAILAGRDFHPRRTLVSNQSQALEIVR